MNDGFSCLQTDKELADEHDQSQRVAVFQNIVETDESGEDTDYDAYDREIFKIYNSKRHVTDTCCSLSVDMLAVCLDALICRCRSKTMAQLVNKRTSRAETVTGRTLRAWRTTGETDSGATVSVSERKKPRSSTSMRHENSIERGTTKHRQMPFMSMYIASTAPPSQQRI